MDLSRILFVLGVGFLLANLRLLFQFIRFLRLRSQALLTWPGHRPPYYAILIVLGAVLSVLIVYKLAILKWHPSEVFGETMMLVYYGYAVPLSLKIGRGFYEDGIWADGGFVPYSRIGGMAWREDEQLTLVLLDRVRDFGRRLTVPERYYGAARRVLRDKIAAHDIHFTGQTLDLSDHDERDVI
ncbi:MAG: hypothetical protein H0W18_10320 [Acidobacteria bacterium]|nr:hypothetical protein [Acidobacteriota bacterium]